MTKKCEKCGKWLKNTRGYNIHYRMMHGQKITKSKILDLGEIPKAPEINPIVNQEIILLKFEIQKLKKLIGNIQVTGTMIPIERIKQNRPEQKIGLNEVNFHSVVDELRAKFSDKNFNSVYDLLEPVNGRTSIEAPPILA